MLDSKVPAGKLEEKWTNHKFQLKLVNPANKRKYNIIVVGTGLAGASAALNRFASRTVQEERIALQHREE